MISDLTPSCLIKNVATLVIPDNKIISLEKIITYSNWNTELLSNESRFSIIDLNFHQNDYESLFGQMWTLESIQSSQIFQKSYLFILTIDTERRLNCFSKLWPINANSYGNFVTVSANFCSPDIAFSIAKKVNLIDNNDIEKTQSNVPDRFRKILYLKDKEE